MVARTKPTGEVAESGGEDPGPDDLEAKIEESVRRVFGKLLDSGDVEVVDTAETKGAKDKEDTLSFRQIESRMEEIVGNAVAELKAKEPPGTEDKATGKTSEPETPPTVKRRRVESIWA